jgi:Na+/H+-dicarboxylate symporter
MDSFGTACNVTGDGAVALVVGKIFSHRGKHTVDVDNTIE